MYYLNHLRFIKLNDRFVPFSTLDLSYLLKDQYDVEFVRRVYSTKVVGSIAELTAQTEGVQGKEEFRLTYRTKADFRKIALQLEIMEDLKVLSTSTFTLCFHLEYLDSFGGF
jgi:alpha-1,3-mannosyl-glycoprotein beta-1,2-N-acetylglucosaminyltransferase